MGTMSENVLSVEVIAPPSWAPQHMWFSKTSSHAREAMVQFTYFLFYRFCHQWVNVLLIQCLYFRNPDFMCLLRLYLFLSTDYTQIRSYTWFIKKVPGVKNSKCCLIEEFEKCGVKLFKLQLLGHTVTGTGMSSKVASSTIKPQHQNQNQNILFTSLGELQP